MSDINNGSFPEWLDGKIGYYDGIRRETSDPSTYNDGWINGCLYGLREIRDRLCPAEEKGAVPAYVIIRSGADSDRGVFTDPYADKCCLSRDKAKARFKELIKECMASLDPRLDEIETGPDFWEAREADYGSAHFERIEISETYLDAGTDG